MRKRAKTLLSVAGFDPSGGAGALLDVNVFNRLGFHGAVVLTAVTTQDTRGVDHVRALPVAFIREQFHVLRRDLRISGVKVGMLGGAGGVKALKDILERTNTIPRVVDPVFRSSSGFPLLNPDAVSAFLSAVKGRASLLTPNLDEAARITGLRPRTLDDMTLAARRVHEMTDIPCLLTGGHVMGPPVDVLFDGRRVHHFRHRRIRKDVHGTGCFLSSAIVAYLARGASLEEACRAAVRMTLDALSETAIVGRGRALFRGFASR